MQQVSCCSLIWVQQVAGSLIGRIDHVLARNDPGHDFGTVAAGVERMGVPDHCPLELRGKSCRRHPVRDTAALGAPLVVGVTRRGG